MLHRACLSYVAGWHPLLSEKLLIGIGAVISFIGLLMCFYGFDYPPGALGNVDEILAGILFCFALGNCII